MNALKGQRRAEICHIESGHLAHYPRRVYSEDGVRAGAAHAIMVCSQDILPANSRVQWILQMRRGGISSVFN